MGGNGSRRRGRRLGSLGAAASAVVVFVLVGVVNYSPAFAQDRSARENAKAETQSSPEALARYSDAANIQNNGEFDLAVEEWTRFLETYPNDPLARRARHYLGICHLQLKHFEDAADALGQVVSRDGEFEFLQESYLNLGWAQYSGALAGKQDWLIKAEDTFAALAEKYPQGDFADQALFYLGESRYLQNKRAEAVDAYTKLVSAHPQSKLRADGLYALGVTHQELEQHVEAGQAFDQFLKGFAQHQLLDEVRMRKAETVLQVGDFAEAAVRFAEVAAMEDFASADHALMRQAYCLAMQEKFREAAVLYARVPMQFRDSPHVPEAIMSSGRSYFRAGDLDESTTWFRKTIESDGADAIEAAHWVCQILLKQNQPAEAAELAARMLARAGDNEFLVHLKLDEADALFESPPQRRDSLSRYLAIAGDHAQHDLAPQALYNACYAAMELSEHVQATQYARRFLKAYPKSSLVADVRYVATECQLLQGHFAEAEALYDKLIAAHGQHPDAATWRLRRALAMFAQEKYQKTVDALVPVISSLKSPESLAEAHFLIGSSHERLERHREAAKALQSSLSASATWRQTDETLLNLARAQRMLNEAQQAKQTIIRLIDEFPESPVLDRAHFELGEYNFQSEDYDPAAQHYTTVIKKWPDSNLVPHALHGKGWAELRSGDHSAASASFTTLLSKHSDHPLAPQTHYARAVCRQQMGQFQEGLADLSVYLQSELSRTEESNAQYLRGLCEVGLKQHDTALATFQSVLDQQPDFELGDKVLYELAWAHKNLNDEPAAATSFQQLASRFPRSELAGEAHYHVGEHAYSQGQFESARESYSRALETSSQEELKEKAVYKLGWANHQLQQYKAALVAFSDQVKSFPEGPLASDGLFMIGECHFKLEDFAKALPAFERARQSPAPSDDVAVLTLLHGGQSAAQLEKWQQSLEWLAPIGKEFASSPYVPESNYERGWAMQNLGRLDEARKLYALVTEASRDEFGARARFMLGELDFQAKQFPAAIREFLRLMYGYGGTDAPAAVKQWQSKAGLEAGRCASVLAGQTDDETQKNMHLDNARKYFRFVTDLHPGSEEAAAAAGQLKKLGRS